MRLLALCLLLSALMTPLTAGAQGATAWQIVLYTEVGAENNLSGELVVMTPSGVQARYPLPASLYQMAPQARAEVAISPDHRYAAIGFFAGTAGSPPPLAIANLEAGTCCTFVTPPIADIDGFALAGFSPDSAQFAASYVGFTNRETFDIESGMMTVDPVTGSILAQIPVETLAAETTGEQWIAFAQPGDWKADGVRFVPSCYACEGVFESPWFIWNPQTNQIMQTTNEYFTILGESLPLTGELLVTTQNLTYPAGETMGILPPANVVEYYAGGVPAPIEQRQAAEAQAPVVYFNPNDLDLRLARWILDGNAFVIQGSELNPQGTIVFRDGARQAVAFGPGDTFLTGTPDGFLAQNALGWVVYYQFIDGTPNLIELEQFERPVQVVEATALGGTVTQPFQLIETGAQAPVEEPPLAPQQEQQPAVTTCPGFLPSRLVPGAQGRVTPGSANRLRAQPSQQAEIVGLMPGDSLFLVISGPQCDPAGIAWWEVEYNGVPGWTAEGQGDSYFVEPV